jgi:hypothetical protein
MRPNNDHSDDFDDVGGFAYDRSQSLHRLVKEARREERHRNRHRGFSKDRHHRDNWDWENDADWDSYDDDSSYEFYEDLNSHY